MAALAGRTRRLRFGMNVVSLALRDPVLLAKQCATIDVLSEGRLLPAFGIGSPLGAGMGRRCDIDTKTRGRRTDESAGDHRPPVARGERRLRRRALPADGRLDLAQAGAARPADVDRRLVRGGDPAHGALRHRLAGRGRRRRPRPAGSSPPSRQAAAEAGRSHRRGSLRREPFPSISAGHATASSRAPWRPMPSAPAATRRAISRSAMSGRSLDRVAEYVAVGVQKFILRPVGDGWRA